jgi:hypothetical protein
MMRMSSFHHSGQWVSATARLRKSYGENGIGHAGEGVPITLILHHLKFYVGGLEPLEHEVQGPLTELVAISQMSASQAGAVVIVGVVGQ